MKKLSIFLCLVFVICFLNLFALRAEDPIYSSTAYNNESVDDQGENDKISDAKDMIEQKKDEAKEAKLSARSTFVASICFALSQTTL